MDVSMGSYHFRGSTQKTGSHQDQLGLHLHGAEVQYQVPYLNVVIARRIVIKWALYYRLITATSLEHGPPYMQLVAAHLPTIPLPM